MHLLILMSLPWAMPGADAPCAGITLLDANVDGTVTLAGDAEMVIDCLFFGRCPPDAGCRVDCNGDGVISVAGDGPCFVDCVFNGNCPAHCDADLPTIWVVQRDPVDCALDLGLAPSEFVDYDTALCELQAAVEALDCMDEQGMPMVAAAGECADGTVLYTAFATQLGGVRQYYDAATGSFLALRTDPRATPDHCPAGLYWPEDLQVDGCVQTLSLCAP